jgi:hypothetical protein
VDPNPKESESFCWIRIRKKVQIRIEIRIQKLLYNETFCEQIEDQTLEREKSDAFLLKNCFSDVRVPEHIHMKAIRDTI